MKGIHILVILILYSILGVALGQDITANANDVNGATFKATNIQADSMAVESDNASMLGIVITSVVTLIVENLRHFWRRKKVAKSLDMETEELLASAIKRTGSKAAEDYLKRILPK